MAARTSSVNVQLGVVFGSFYVFRISVNFDHCKTPKSRNSSEIAQTTILERIASCCR